MQIVSWLLVTSALAAPAPAPSAPAAQPETAISFDAAQQRSTVAPLPTTMTPSRTLGLGGALSVSNYGISGQTRYNFTRHIGAALYAGWQRPRVYSRQFYTTSAAYQVTTPSSVSVTPSIIFSFNETDQNREVSLRPFVGVGAGYVRASRGSFSNVPASALQTYRYSATTEYASFGSEIFFRDHPNFALSAEGIYYNIPSNFINRYYTDGMNFQVAATFYIK